MTAIPVNEVAVGPVTIRLLEREHADYPNWLSVDYVMIARDARTPQFAAMAFCGYDHEMACRKFERAVEIAQQEAA
jgi:hypothetical protein